MFVINVTITEPLDVDGASERLNAHRDWFTKHFEAGDFALVGPYHDGPAGLILARTHTRETLETILAEDAFYPDGARYEVREFTPNLVAQDLAEIAGS